MSGLRAKQLDQIVFVLIEETRRPLRKTAISTYLRRRHDRPTTVPREIVKRHVLRLNQSVPNRDSNPVHEVVAVRLGNDLDASQRSTDRELGQSGLAPRVQMGFGILN